MKLSQSRGVLRIDSEILSDGVFYRERNLLSSNEVKIPFEHISAEPVRTFHVPRLYLFISLFFALMFAIRLVRYFANDGGSLLSLAWSAVLFVVPTLGTWMQSPKYVGYLTSRGALLFFEKDGPQDPAPYLDEVQRAKAAYFRHQYGNRAAASIADEGESTPPLLH